MSSTKSNLAIKIIALLLIAVTAWGIIYIIPENSSAAVRTVSLSSSTVESQSHTKYLEDFDNYEIISKDDCSVKFIGQRKYNTEAAELFDNISSTTILDDANYNMVYDCEFIAEKMQFIFTANLLDADNKVIESDQYLTDAFINEAGRLDAYIEIDGEKYLLSEYENREVLDNCFFGWLKAITVAVVLIVVTYVVVSETAEQIKARKNYEYNKKLEATGNGVNYKNYITKQNEFSKSGYKSGDYNFGFAKFANVGCEVASVYNLLISINKAERLSETIYNFEKWAIEYAIGWGHLGSDPNAIYRYLNHRSISYTKYTTYSSFKKALNNKKNCHIIMSTWNNGGALKSIFNGNGLHTYFLKKNSKSSFLSYNLNYSNSAELYNNIDEIYAEGGDFIVAYIIG